ncbi:MAG: O-antigen ligase family protein [Acidimicrobiia bacterium]|nr:O-antigen ligase family protein [Acidimicrobiia bacterium]
MLTVAESRARRRAARQEQWWRRPMMPLAVVMVGFPVWAVLGMAQAIWVAMAAVMAVRLLGARRVRIPAGFGIWVAFVVWTAVSALQLTDRPGSLIGAGYRVAMYAAAGVILLYVFNLSERQLSTEWFLRWSIIPLAVLTIGGLAGMILGERDLFSLPLAVLPGSARSSSFLIDLLTPRFAQVQAFLGFDLPRPAFPYRFTNQWGSVMAVLVPLAIAGIRFHRLEYRVLARFLLVLSLVPIVVSVNRGLWLSLAASFLYVTVRRAGSGRALPAIRLVLGALVVVLFITLTPLGDLVADRAESDHSNRSRATLVSLTLDQVQDSPLVGFGAPRPDEENPNLPPVGTHGQIWTVLFSHGWVGAILFGLFLVVLAWRTREDLDDVHLWLHAVTVGLLVQMWFYNLFPGALALGFVAAGLLLRRRRLPVRPRTHRSPVVTS